MSQKADSQMDLRNMSKMQFYTDFRKKAERNRKSKQRTVKKNIDTDKNVENKNQQIHSKRFSYASKKACNFSKTSASRS